jgi:hypothetical protein
MNHPSAECPWLGGPDAAWLNISFNDTPCLQNETGLCPTSNDCNGGGGIGVNESRLDLNVSFQIAGGTKWIEGSAPSSSFVWYYVPGPGIYNVEGYGLSDPGNNNLLSWGTFRKAIGTNCIQPT